MKEWIEQGHREGLYSYNLRERDLWDDQNKMVSTIYWKTSRREEGAGKKVKRIDRRKM
jgi:hypothetical protein